MLAAALVAIRAAATALTQLCALGAPLQARVRELQLPSAAGLAAASAQAQLSAVVAYLHSRLGGLELPGGIAAVVARLPAISGQAGVRRNCWAIAAAAGTLGVVALGLARAARACWRNRAAAADLTGLAEAEDEDLFEKVWSKVEASSQGHEAAPERPRRQRPSLGGARAEREATPPPKGGRQRRGGAEGGAEGQATGVSQLLALLTLLNDAPEKDLLLLPGVGPRTAGAVVAHRARGERLRSLEDLVEKVGLRRPLVARLAAAPLDRRPSRR